MPRSLVAKHESCVRQEMCWSSFETPYALHFHIHICQTQRHHTHVCVYHTSFSARIECLDRIKYIMRALDLPSVFTTDGCWFGRTTKQMCIYKWKKYANGSVFRCIFHQCNEYVNVVHRTPHMYMVDGADANTCICCTFLCLPKESKLKWIVHCNLMYNIYGKMSWNAVHSLYMNVYYAWNIVIIFRKTTCCGVTVRGARLYHTRI